MGSPSLQEPVYSAGFESRREQNAKESKKRKEVCVVNESDQLTQEKKKEIKPYFPRYEFNKDLYSILME